MTCWKEWLKNQKSIYTVPLFSEKELLVETFKYGCRKLLKRSEKFDECVINIVENGLENEDWKGFIYIMNWDHYSEIVPLYIGKTEKKGTRNTINSNLVNIRKNQDKFARWGYGLDYHIGGLSHAIFGELAYKQIEPRYKRWANLLFSELNPPVLKEKAYVSIISWYEGMQGPSGILKSVPTVEKELITLVGSKGSNVFLNKDGT